MRKNLKELRIKKGLCQEEVSKAIGITRVFLSNIESSSKNPSLEVAFQLAEFYGIEIDPSGIIKKTFGSFLRKISLSDMYKISKELNIEFDSHNLFKECS